MSDNHRRYRSIRNSLSQMYAVEPKGMEAKQLTVLAGLISGIVGSRSTNYPKIASQVPDRVKLESRVKRYSRYVNEADPKEEVQLMPFAEQLLANLADQTLVLIMDGRPRPNIRVTRGHNEWMFQRKDGFSHYHLLKDYLF